jgi:membrane AbrB-like protein
MSMDVERFSLRRPAAWPSSLRWGALVALSLIFAAALAALQLPAAPLLGPMIAAVLLAANGGAVQTPRPAFSFAQGIVGVMIAGFLPRSIFAEIGADWPIFLIGTLSTIAAASFLGWRLTRSRALPGTTAIWGSSPGAATAMTLMSESYGADLRLVAFMQYTRVACCAVVAAGAARLFGTPAVHVTMSSQAWSSQGVVAALAIALLGGLLGVRLRIPGGGLLLPMAISVVVALTGLVSLTLPTPVLAVGYAVLGWGFGMRFTPDVLRHAARAMPRVLGSILTLIAICGGFGAVLVVAAGVDPLTAYLATSPGGVDSVSIIAASTKVDMPFVLAMQVARFVLVVVFGPAQARWLSRSAKPAEA